MAKKVLFIDRDGTIINEPEDQQIDSFSKLEFLPGVISALAKIARELDYELVLVSNQDGLGTEAFPEETFHPVHNFIISTLAGEGVTFSEQLIDKSYEHEGKDTRKPGTGMLGRYIYGDYDLANSYVIGDRVTDIQLAENLGARAIYIAAEKNDRAALTTTSWDEIYRCLKAQPRAAEVRRTTHETDVTVKLNLDEAAGAEINTGLEFLNHMLQQVAKHGGMRLEVLAKGDLQVDEHHTVEDVAITLGEALDAALGSKKGIARYGFLLPMDDALAQVAIDLGGRAALVWDVQFNREYVGDVPTEMFKHFFYSFSQAARCNLNIKAEGENDHHKAEVIFKAFSKALAMATAKTGGNELPSTKGLL